MAGTLDKLETGSGTISPTRALLGTVGAILGAYWFILVPAALLVRLVYIRYASPLRRYPGPLVASVTRLWKVYSVYKGNTQWDHINLHRKYGPIVRIAPNEVSVASPEAARQLLSAGKRFYKTDFYWVFPPPESPEIFTEIREDVHAGKKKVANGPYSMAAMQQLAPYIDDTIDRLCGKLETMAAAPTSHARGPEINLGDWIHYFSFDVLGEVAFSRTFGFLDEGRDVEDAIKTIDQSQTYNGLVGQIPEMDYLLRRNPLWKLIPSMSTTNALCTRMAYEEMNRRRPFNKETSGVLRSGDGRQDLLASLIKAHLKDPSRFNENDVFGVAHGAIFAGSDSTASTMQSMFWHVLSDRRIAATLSQEIQIAVSEGRVPASGNIAWLDAQSLTYFQACLKEAMRVRPAVGLDITRYVPPEGAEIDGHHFRGGTRIAANGWVLHRDKGVFGQDADEYRPERWLEDEANAKRMERFMFHFGGGAHVCIGRNLALLQINKLVPRLFRDFNFELVHGAQLKAHASFFVVQNGLIVHLQKR